MNILAVIIVFGLSSLAIATPAKVVDGTVMFPVATFNGQTVWTVAEKDDMVSRYNDKISSKSATVATLTPEDYEINIATIVGRFKSYSNFLSHQTKEGLKPKLLEFKQELDLLKDLGETNPTLQRKYDWLKHYYGTL